MLGPFFLCIISFSGDFWSCQVDTFHTPQWVAFFGGTQKNPPPNWPDNAAKNGVFLGRNMSADVQFNLELGGGFKYLLFSPLPGEDSQFDKWVETTN